MEATLEQIATSAPDRLTASGRILQRWTLAGLTEADAVRCVLAGCHWQMVNGWMTFTPDTDATLDIAYAWDALYRLNTDA